jgi:hypothetical protein
MVGLPSRRSTASGFAALGAATLAWICRGEGKHDHADERSLTGCVPIGGRA